MRIAYASLLALSMSACGGNPAGNGGNDNTDCVGECGTDTDTNTTRTVDAYVAASMETAEWDENAHQVINIVAIDAVAEYELTCPTHETLTGITPDAPTLDVTTWTAEYSLDQDGLTFYGKTAVDIAETSDLSANLYPLIDGEWTCTTSTGGSYTPTEVIQGENGSFQIDGLAVGDNEIRPNGNVLYRYEEGLLADPSEHIGVLIGDSELHFQTRNDNNGDFWIDCTK